MSLEIVEIVWTDSFNTTGWREPTALDTTPIHIYSIGILVATTEDTITITTSSGAHGHVMDPLTIPKVAIVSFRNLTLTKGGKMSTKITPKKKKVAKITGKSKKS